MQKNEIGALILRTLMRDELIAALAAGDFAAVDYHLARYLRKNSGGVADYILEKLLIDENLLAYRAVQGKASEAILAAAAQEIAVLQGWLAAYSAPVWAVEGAAVWNEDFAALADWQNLPADEVVRLLADYHQKCGFGKLARHHIWRWQGELLAVENYDCVRLDDLVGMQAQKDDVMQNTRLFLYEGRGNNMLLYGARGTGKSSLIKAAVNELAAEGLCLIELPLEYMADLPQILQQVAGQPRHYIIFVDDLSFEKADKSYKVTKAVLEGSVAALGENVRIYATSNRRHLVVENWQDREGIEPLGGEVRASDSMSEKFSLADRFGQTVLFASPNQTEFLAIVQSLAAADGIDMPAEELEKQALRWSLWQNGRSGRTARQFINSLTKEALQ